MSRKNNNKIIVIVIIILGIMLMIFNGKITPRMAGEIIYYVDSENGNDENNGLSADTPFKTISRANEVTLYPGDSMLFKRGSSWRAAEDAYIKVQGGSEAGYITYGAYGEGDLPMIIGSIEANDPSDWENIGGNLWMFPASGAGTIGEELLQNPSFDSGISSWTLYASSQANATGVRTTITGEYDSSPAGYIISTSESGLAKNDIQLYTTGISIQNGKTYELTFRAKATQQFTLSDTALIKATSPWSSYAATSIDDLDITTDWKIFKIYFSATTSASDGRITFYLGNVLPDGQRFYIDTLSLKEITTNSILIHEVGNIIFNHETAVGTNEWNLTDVNKQGDFRYDNENKVIVLYSTSNPATYYSDIEIATSNKPVTYGGGGLLIRIPPNEGYIIFENLNLKYDCGGSIGGSWNNHNIIIRDTKEEFIGGCWMYYNNYPVRFGNSLGFWCSSSDIYVMRNNISDTWDAAMSPQCSTDSGPATITRQVYSYNIIDKAAYGFEIFNSAIGSEISNILIEHNSLLNMGGGVMSSQPGYNGGRQFRLARSPENTKNLTIRDNIIAWSDFAAIDLGRGSFNNWKGELPKFNNNLYWGMSGNFIRWGGSYYTSLTTFSNATGMETGGKYINPQLEDYRPSGEACTMGSDGGYVGAVPCRSSYQQEQTTTQSNSNGSNNSTEENTSKESTEDNNEQPATTFNNSIIIIILVIIAILLFKRKQKKK